MRRSRGAFVLFAVAATVSACEWLGNLGQKTPPSGAPSAIVQPPPIYPMSYYGPPPTPRWVPPAVATSASAAPSQQVPPAPVPVPPGYEADALVYASAPSTLTTEDLGRPCDEKFHLVRGEAGAPLYGRREGVAAGSSGMSASFVEAHSSRELGATAEAWSGIVGVDLRHGTESRYLVYRASQQSDILQVNDATAWRHPPPPEAVWYVASIFVGRSWEVIIYGDQRKFHAGIKAKWAQFGIKLEKTELDEGVFWQAYGRGLESVSDRAIFAQSPQEIMARYRESKSPVPIWVGYRNIPGKPVKLPEHLEWASAPVPDKVNVTRNSFSCDCVDGPAIAMRCSVRNEGGRSMDITVRAHGETGTTGAHAEAVQRIRVPAQSTREAFISAPIDTIWQGVNCHTAVGCMCEIVESYPSTQ